MKKQTLEKQNYKLDMLAHKDILNAELCFPLLETAEQRNLGFYLLLGAFPFPEQYPGTSFCFFKEAFTHLKSFHHPRTEREEKVLQGMYFCQSIFLNMPFGI